jgi:hypothetical protein
MNAATEPTPRDPPRERVFNWGTALGLIYVPLTAFLLLWLVIRDEPGEVAAIFLAYFLVTFVVFFVLLRLLPYRGLKAVLIASPFVLASSFAMWWGGLGLAAAIPAALAFPNRFER